jgi:hypothetical protein
VWDWKALLHLLRRYMDGVLDVRVGRLYVEVMVLSGDRDFVSASLRGLGEVVGIRDVDREECGESGLGGFVRLFNQWRFWEAHEVLEKLWRITRGDVREVLQGLIQLAAAFVHWQHENEGGFRRVITWSMDHLGRCRNCLGVDTDRVLAWEAQFLELPIREVRPPLLPQWG